jgi:hypothetical protein
MGVHNLAHSGFYTGSPSQEFIGRMKAQGTYLTTTLASVVEQMLTQFEPERLNDSLTKLTVPAELLATAADPEAWRRMYAILAQSFLPAWVPNSVSSGSARLLGALKVEKLLQRSVKNASSAIRQMYEAGIPIVLGTDSSNLPAFISFFHGPSTIREVELLSEAGMAPMDVLRSATTIPAEMMGIDDLVGTVEVGKRADLLVVGEDPLMGLSAVRRSVRYTIRDGDARTPEEWMRVAGTPVTEIRLKEAMTGEGTWRSTETPQKEDSPTSSPTPAS